MLKLTHDGQPTSLKAGDRILYYETKGYIAIQRNTESENRLMFVYDDGPPDDKLMIGLTSRLGVASLCKLMAGLCTLEAKGPESFSYPDGAVVVYNLVEFRN